MARRSQAKKDYWQWPPVVLRDIPDEKPQVRGSLFPQHCGRRRRRLIGQSTASVLYAGRSVPAQGGPVMPPSKESAVMVAVAIR
jgi:hypothetical protein